MVGAIKEVCIFVIIAQAVMFFVPGNSYMKYVRILVGILMILKITEPIFGLFLDEEKEREIKDRIMLLEQEIDISSEKLELEDNSVEIYENITDELKNRLNACESGYEVLDVELTEEQMLVITVRKKRTETNEDNKIKIETIIIGEDMPQQENVTKDQEQSLKEALGSCISVDAERIKLLFQD